MNAMDIEANRALLKNALDTMPEKALPVALRFLQLTIEDDAFWSAYQAVVAERGLLPLAEMSAFMDCWTEAGSGGGVESHQQAAFKMRAVNSEIVSDSDTGRKET